MGVSSEVTFPEAPTVCHPSRKVGMVPGMLRDGGILAWWDPARRGRECRARIPGPDPPRASSGLALSPGLPPDQPGLDSTLLEPKSLHFREI